MPDIENNKISFAFIKKINLEILFLLIFVGAMLFMTSVFDGGKLVHDSPYQYVAGDMFFLLSGADWIADSEDVTKYPAYLAGGADNQFPGLPPLFPIVTAAISDLSGIANYDVLFHLNILFNVLIIGGVYLALRKINVPLAILGIPVSLLIFKWPFNYSITWGMQMANMNFFFIIVAIVIFIFLDMPGIFLIFGVLNAGSFFSHMRELITFGLGLGLYFLFTLVKRNFDWIRLKKTLYSFIVSGIIVSYYLPILRNMVKMNTGGQGSIISYCPAMTHVPHFVILNDIGLFKWLFILGICIAVIMCIIKKKITLEYLVILTFGFACIFTSYFCIVGNKTSHMRNFLPFYAALFIPLVLLFNPALFHSYKKIIAFFGSILLLLLVVTSHFPEKIGEYAVSNPLTWQSFDWIKSNTEPNATVLTLYGDNFYQYTLFFSMKRTIYETDRDAYIKSIQANTISPTLLTYKRYLGKKLVRDGNSLVDAGYGLANVSVCNVDYVYSNKVSQIAPIQEYTTNLLNILINEANFSKIYDNQLAVLLKNNDVGGSCFKERKT